MMNILFVVIVFLIHQSSQSIVFNNTVTSNTSWHLINTDPLIFMRMEYDFTFIFPSEECCPLFGHRATFLDGPCFDTVKMHVSLSWVDHILVRFSTGLQGGIAYCHYINNKTYIECTGSSKVLYSFVRQRYFFLGYGCHEVNSLKGITYSITITSFSNHTMCGPVVIDECPGIQYSAFPSTYGDKDVYDTQRTLNYLQNAFKVGDNFCYRPDLYNEFLCIAIFYKCPGPGIHSQFTVPCREFCLEFMEICKTDSPAVQHTSCYIYPSVNESSSCKYKTFCLSPPQIENGIISYQRNLSRYETFSQVEYICMEGYFMVGNSTSMCKNTGFWKPLPTCQKNTTHQEDIKSETESSTSTLIIILGFTAALILIVLIFVSVLAFRAYTRCRRKNEAKNNYSNGYGERNKTYDVFLSYFDDGRNETQPQKDFIFKIVLSHLESISDPPFKVITHPRNFIAGVYIKENVQNAISNSNAVVILMSKEYVTSNWCRYEFEECTFENTEDSAFRMLVILYEPVENLGELTPDMKTFFRSKTYLELDDPQLLDKITDVLRLIRGEGEETV